MKVLSCSVFKKSIPLLKGRTIKRIPKIGSDDVVVLFMDNFDFEANLNLHKSFGCRELLVFPTNAKIEVYAKIDKTTTLE